MNSLSSKSRDYWKRALKCCLNQRAAILQKMEQPEHTIKEAYTPGFSLPLAMQLEAIKKGIEHATRRSQSNPHD